VQIDLKLPPRWDRWVVPKRRCGITATRCLIAQKSAVLSSDWLYCYPINFSHCVRSYWFIYRVVERVVLFPADRIPCPVSSAIVLQLFAPFNRLYTPGCKSLVSVLGNSRHPLGHEFPRYHHNKCRFFSYKIMCNVNLLSELPSHCYQISDKMGRMCSTHGMTTNAQDILVRN